MPRRTPLQEMQMLAGLDETSELVEMDADQERLYDELFLMASNEGDFYRKRDARGAVEYSFKEYLKNIRVRAREDYSVIKAKLVKDLAKRWKTESVDEALGPETPETLFNHLDYIEEELRKAKASLKKLRSDPRRFAPQRENVMHHVREIGKVARAILYREGKQ